MRRSVTEIHHIERLSKIETHPKYNEFFRIPISTDTKIPYKTTDILTLIFGITSAFIAIAALILALSKKNILFIEIATVILIGLLCAIIFTYWKIPKSNIKLLLNPCLSIS